ncbi:N-lysine methyltransferase SMYD2 [Eurytemora carolleeae]|uniref:N-lysine methyltransferase SMYD2 n=1 Tax=Eurytemora carolleeae TaxID=1294199 RepID=UPI000C75BC0B|nr:N-lysine methyltransferase SMYD2 [Eurytemora carolleeae]|eukprot:XP_023327551.1 N-lysine methyltransferase SMYD2-like [Eurytemora affinis]
MSKTEEKVGKIIFRLQEGIQYNLHTVDGVQEAQQMTGISTPVLTEIGSAVFPTLLLLNHSCEPNTIRISGFGNQVVMVAKRKIKKGQEITDNYGIHHLSLPFEERQECLKRGFSFSCCCEACAKDYPRMKSLRSQLPESVEDKFDIMRDDLKDKFKKGDHNACFRMSKEMIQLLEKNNVVYPHRSYEQAALCLTSCLWTLYGNRV